MGVICISLVWNSDTVKGCQPQLLRLVKSLRGDKVAGVIGEDRRNNFWRVIWVHLNLGAGNDIFSRGAGRWHCLKVPKSLTEPLPGTRNHQDVNDARRGVVGGNDDDDYDDGDHYLVNQRGRRCGGGPREQERGGGGMIHYTLLAFRQVNLEGFDAVVMHLARIVPPGSRVCKLYAGVGVLGLTELLYHHRMSKVEEDDDYDDYGGGGRRPLRWLRCSNENTTNTRCFDRAVGSM